MYNYIINDEESLNFLLGFIFNPLKERTSYQFKKVYKDYSGYKIDPMYALIFDDLDDQPKQNTIILSQDDMNYAYIRAARMYTMLINPDNLKLLMKQFKNFIEIFIGLTTKVLTPSKSSYNPNSSMKRPCVSLIIHYCSYLLSIQPDITLSYMMEKNTLFTFLITTPKMSDVLQTNSAKMGNARRRGAFNLADSGQETNPLRSEADRETDLLAKEDFSKSTC